MRNIKQEVSAIIEQCYSERKQKIFKSQVHIGQPPICQFNHNTATPWSKSIFSLEQILPETICSQSAYIKECRSQPVRNPHGYPYSAIGCVVYESEGLTRYCTVLTSAIACINPITRKSTDRIYFHSGCSYACCNNWKNTKTIKTKVIKVYYRQQFSTEQGFSVQNEICVLELEDSLMKQCGYLGIMFANFHKPQQKQKQQQESEGNRESMRVMLSGFGMTNSVHDRILTQSYVPIAQIKFDQSNTMIHHCIETTYGYIGSPLFIHDQTNQKCYIIGIHLGRNQHRGQSSQYKNTRMINQFITEFSQPIYRRKGVLHLQKYNNTATFDSKRTSDKPIMDKHLLAELVQVQLPYLNGLGLNHQRITAAGTKLLVDSPWRVLLWIQLWDNQLGTNAMKNLSKCNWPHLSRLSLSDNKIDAEGVRHLAKSQWTNLTVLSMPSNLINSNGCLELSSSHWPQLSILVLTQNKIDPISVHYIASLSTNFSRLAWLELYENGMGSFSNSQLVQSLGQMYSKLYVYS